MSRLVEDPTLRNRIRVFRDRRDAGVLLAKALSGHKGSDGMVLGIPSGGVPVAAEIARSLGFPLDLVIVRKIQLPHNTEAGFGAVGPDGEVSLNRGLIAGLGLSDREVETQIQKTKEILRRRNELFRGGTPFPSVRGKVVVVVDDGLASGYTMLSAADFIRSRGPEKIIVAVPTAPKRTVDLIMPHVDELVCLNVRGGTYFAVADAYENWHDLGDEEVISLLKGFRAQGKDKDERSGMDG